MASLKQLATSSKFKNSLIYYDSIYFLSRMCNFFSSFSNSKIFASAKTCRGKSCGTIVWNISAIKTANVNLVYDGKMADQVGNSIFVLKLVSGGFRSQNNKLSRPRSQSLILKIEKSGQAFFRVMWLLRLVGSSTNEEHNNPIV